MQTQKRIDAIKASKANYEKTRTSIRISKELAAKLKEKAGQLSISIEKYISSLVK